jgi:hypothetical protein
MRRYGHDHQRVTDDIDNLNVVFLSGLEHNKYIVDIAGELYLVSMDIENMAGRCSGIVIAVKSGSAYCDVGHGGGLVGLGEMPSELVIFEACTMQVEQGPCCGCIAGLHCGAAGRHCHTGPSR